MHDVPPCPMCDGAGGWRDDDDPGAIGDGWVVCPDCRDDDVA